MLSHCFWFVAWECTIQGQVARNSCLYGSGSNEPDKAFAEVVQKIREIEGIDQDSVLITGFNRV